MSEINDTPLAEDEEQDGSTDRLLRDLKSLPKVSAPLDFEYHLREQIEKLDAAKADPWWKSFFLYPNGELRIPVLAYGSTAAVVILAFALYVYDATDFEQSMPLKQQRVLDTEFNDLPAAEDDTRSNSSLEEEEMESNPGDQQSIPGESQPALDEGSAAPPPAPSAPAGVHKKERSEETFNDEQRVSPGEQNVGRAEGKNAPAAKRPRTADEKQDQRVAPVDEADRNSKVDYLKYAPSRKTTTDTDNLSSEAESPEALEAVQDAGSGRELDSLRKLDSLRSLKQDNKPDADNKSNAEDDPR